MRQKERGSEGGGRKRERDRERKEGETEEKREIGNKNETIRKKERKTEDRERGC